MTCSESNGLPRHALRLQVLRRQIERLDRCLAELEEQSRRIVRWRLLSFVLMLVGSAAALLTWGPIPFLVSGLVLLLGFIYWVWRHRKIDAAVTRLRIWQQLKQDQMARMTLDWDEIPPVSYTHLTLPTTIPSC